MICSCLAWLQGYISGAGTGALRTGINRIKFSHMMGEYVHQYKTTGSLGVNLPPMDYLTACEALTRLYPCTFHIHVPKDEKGVYLMVTKKLNSLSLYRATLELHFKKDITPPIKVLSGTPIQLYDLDKQELNIALLKDKNRIHFTYVRCTFSYNNQGIPRISVMFEYDDFVEKQVASYIST